MLSQLENRCGVLGQLRLRSIIEVFLRIFYKSLVVDITLLAISHPGFVTFVRNLKQLVAFPSKNIFVKRL